MQFFLIKSGQRKLSTLFWFHFSSDVHGIQYLDVQDRHLRSLMNWLDEDLKGPVKKLSENGERLSGYLTLEHDFSELYSKDQLRVLNKDTIQLQLYDPAYTVSILETLLRLKRKYVKVHLLFFFFLLYSINFDLYTALYYC